jgi:hypothetical protein
MRKIKYNVARNDLARVYLKTNRSCCSYQLNDLMSVADVTQSRSDVQKVEASDPDQYGKFTTIDIIPGELERMTGSLTITMLTDKPNGLYDFLYKARPIDFQVHFGECSSPFAFNEFNKALIFEDVYATNWTATSLVTTTASERAPITETVEISIGAYYEIYNMFTQVMNSNFSDTADGPFVATAIQCVNDCNMSGIGTYGTTNVFLLQIKYNTVYCDNTALNVSQPSLILWYSWDGGTTFSTIEIDNFEFVTSSNLATCSENVHVRSIHLDVFNNILYLTAGLGHAAAIDLSELFYNEIIKLKYYSDVLETFNWIAYDQVVLNGYLLIAGEDGRIWKLNNTFSDKERIYPVEALAYDEPFVSIHGIDENTFIAGHDMGVFKYKNGQMQLIPTSPDAVTNVWMFSQDYMIASTTRSIFASCNGGITWNVVHAILNDECIMDFKFATNQVGYMITNSPTLGPRVYRSLDMGCTWKLIEQNSISNLYNLTSLAVCNLNPNSYIATGLFQTIAPLNLTCDLSGSYVNLLSTYDGLILYGKVTNNEYKLNV